MWKNQIKLTLRTLQRAPGYAAINLGGLAVGIACFLLILLYVHDEVTFDRFHERSNDIVRVLEARSTADQAVQHFAYTMGPLGPALVAELPEVEASVRMISRSVSGRMTVEHGPARFYSAAHLFAEPSFFEVFDFELLRGNATTALAAPGSVVLTEETARTFYGDADPLGQPLAVERFGEFTVTGVLRDPPLDSHLDFSMLLSFATLEALENWNNWLGAGRSTGVMTYLRLDESADAAAVEAKMTPIFERLVEESEVARRAYVQPLHAVHLQSGHVDFDENARRGAMAYVYIFGAIALFLVLIACINYMNLATARSMRRAREVGVRKAVGARRGQLVRQFLLESVLLTGGAFVLAFALVGLVLPYFNDFAGKDLSIGAGGGFVVLLVGLALLLGVAAGLYPALYLSGFRPARVLRRAGTAGGSAARLRRGLVVTQFALSIVLLVATAVVYRQMQYVQTTQLGFNEEQLIVIDINSGDVRRDFAAVRAAFAAVPAVERVSVSSNVPGDWKNITQIDVGAATAPADALTKAYFLGIDETFFETFEMQLVQGDGFIGDFGRDSLSVVLNEAAAAQLGVGVGDQIRVPGSSLFPEFADATFEPRVVGIVEDFHFQSLHETIAPMVLAYRTNPIDVIDYFTVRTASADVPATVEALRAVGERFDPSHPFEYNFLDERLADFYRTEARVGRIFGVAAGLAVLIACLGLLGLAAFAAEQRTKEIGIRKVMGASVPGLVLLLSGDFLKLVGLAFVVAAPLSYFAMRSWLSDFAYRITLGPDVFVFAGLAALAVALLTVSYQALRAALADPVRSLRYE